MTKPKLFCEGCQRWLEHDQSYCPLFTNIAPPYDSLMFEPGKKWTKCVCLVHTCSEAPKRDKYGNCVKCSVSETKPKSWTAKELEAMIPAFLSWQAHPLKVSDIDDNGDSTTNFCIYLGELDD